MSLTSVLRIRGKMCRDYLKKATEGRAGFPGVITTVLDIQLCPGSMGSLPSSRMPEKTCLPRGSVHQCLIHAVRMAAESKVVLTVRAASRSISSPWGIVSAPAITKLFPFPSYAALSYCFFSTVPSSGWEAGLGFSLRGASPLQVPLQIFY